MKKRAWFSVLFVLIVLSGFIFLQYPKLNIISGYTAKYMASGVFIADRSVSSLTEQDTNVPLVKLAEAEVDILDKEASADVFGLLERTAICRDGLGCVLINDEYEPGPYLRPNRNPLESDLLFPYGEKVVDTIR
ncbi:MAG: serine hydrolase, partial [Eudoraea sp.]|nr:serine hydrolase [Eudoraea sp.]